MIDDNNAFQRLAVVFFQRPRLPHMQKNTKNAHMNDLKSYIFTYIYVLDDLPEFPKGTWNKRNSSSCVLGTIIVRC